MRFYRAYNSVVVLLLVVVGVWIKGGYVMRLPYFMAWFWAVLFGIGVIIGVTLVVMGI